MTTQIERYSHLKEIYGDQLTMMIDHKIAGLTTGEARVSLLLMCGFRGNQIQGTLHISAKRYEVIVRQIREKTESKTTAEALVKLCIQLMLLSKNNQMKYNNCRVFPTLQQNDFLSKLTLKNVSRREMYVGRTVSANA